MLGPKCSITIQLHHDMQVVEYKERQKIIELVNRVSNEKLLEVMKNVENMWINMIYVNE